MKQEILDKYGLTEAEFYKKYPTEAAFRKAHPEDFKAMKKTFAKGGKLPEGILKARLESHMSPEEVNDYIANYASGGMIKRADGSYSKRGLWDNIRANKGSGKKPTKEMLKQEAKIRAQEKAMGGYMYAEGGKLPTEILRARLESHMSSDEAQDYINEYGKGGYTVTRSNDRKGKTHKVTGPDGTVKYFGDSKLGQHPKDPKRKKAFYARHATNLKNNPYFRAFARATWAEGGYIDPSYTVEDFAKGGRFWKNFGAGAYGAGEGLIDTLSMGLTDSLTDQGYQALQNIGKSTEDEIREQNAVRGFSNTAGAITGGILNPAATGSAVSEGAEGLGAGISNTWGEDSEAARMAGQILPAAGNVAGMFMGDVGSGSAQAAKFAGSDFGKAMKTANKTARMYNTFSPFMNMGTMQAKGGYMPSIAGALEGFTYAYGGELIDLEGPKHSEGGIMLTKNAEVEGGETKLGNYIFSDQLEVPGKKGITFAKESKRIRNKYKLRKGGDIYDKEQENLELMDLQDMNEEAKAVSKAKEAFEMAKGGWIKKATESIKRRGTEGVCTGSKFGGPTCPPGSKRYNLAKTFRKMAKNRKHAEGGFVGDLYALGGNIDMFSNGGPFLSDEGYAAINEFENTMGTYDPQGNVVGMGAGDQYAQSNPDNKKIQDYISNTIGMDTWDKLPDNVKTQAYSFMFNTGKNDAGLKGLAQAINNATGGGDLGDERRAYTPDQAIKTIKNADLSNPNLYDNYVNVLGDQYNSIAANTRKFQTGPGAKYAPTLRNRALSINKILNPNVTDQNPTIDNSFYPTPTGEAIEQPNPFYPTPSGKLLNEFYPTPDGKLPESNTKKPFYPTPDGNLPKSPNAGNKFGMSDAASMFGKYGSLLGIPLNALALQQSNKAIKDELKRLQGEKPEVVDYGKVSLERAKPITLDPTQALLATDRESRIGRRNAETVGAGNLATMMANKQIADATAMKQKATTIGEYENANRQIQNAFAERNAAIANQEALANKELEKAGMDATSFAKANYQNQLFKLAQAKGLNRANYLGTSAKSIGDTAQNVKYNKDTLNILMNMFSSPEGRKLIEQFS